VFCRPPEGDPEGISIGSRARGAARKQFRPRLVQRNNEATTDMATNPKKITDPTEAALSAIQDALQVRDPEPAEPEVTALLPPPPAPVLHHDAKEEPTIDRPWPGRQARDAAPAPESFDDEVRMGEDAPTLRRPA